MKNRILPSILLLAYGAILVKVMVLKDVPMISIGPVTLNFGGTQVGDPNYVPFRTILPYLLGDNGFLIGALNIGGNIAFLIPIGFLLPFVFVRIDWKKSLVVAVLSGMSIELTQVFLHIGIFDIDDVILNALGVMLGYWMYIFFRKIMSSSYRKVAIVGISVLSTAAIVSLFVYAKQNELGFEPVHESNQQNRVGQTKDGAPQGVDPCNGTMGTGQIIGLTETTITIKRRDGKEEVVVLTEKTSMSNSAGPITKSMLQVGDRVTVVIDDSNTAFVVLVCGINH
jgi:glycopeptide antibiotics resistance protein